MFHALTIASNALQVQSQKLGAIASAVASQGVTLGDTDMRRHTMDVPQVRIGSLPVVKDGRLIGIVTERDFMDIAFELLEEKLND